MKDENRKVQEIREFNRKKSKKHYDLMKSDPYAAIVRDALREAISDKSNTEMVENLKKFGKHYSNNAAFKTAVLKSSMSAREMIRFFIAAGKKEIKITISDKQIEELLKIEYN